MIHPRALASAFLFCLVCGCVPPGAMGVSQPASFSQPSARPEAPVLRRLPNGHYRVRKPWKVLLGGRVYHVQKGYTSNGITAPDAIKSSLGDGIQHPETWAAVFHDWLFTQPGMSRSTADRLFYELLRSYGVPETKARLMYTSVSAYSARKQAH